MLSTFDFMSSSKQTEITIQLVGLYIRLKAEVIGSLTSALSLIYSPTSWIVISVCFEDNKVGSTQHTPSFLYPPDMNLLI